MIPLFKAGWFRLLLGAGFLYAALVLLHRARGGAVPIFQPFLSFPVLSGQWMIWIPLGIVLDISILLFFFSMGTLIAPRLFPRAFLTSCARLYGGHGPFLVLACGLVAAGLEEPLFRWEIQKQSANDLGVSEGIVLAALLQAAAYWSPLTNLLALLAFARGLLFGFLYDQTGHPLTPALVHGIGELMFIGGIAFLGRFGLTSVPPDGPPAGSRT